MSLFFPDYYNQPNNAGFRTVLVVWEKPFMTSLKVAIYERFTGGCAKFQKRKFKKGGSNIKGGSDPSAHYEPCS